MGLDSTTMGLRKELDDLEKRQKAPDYMPSFRRTRALSSATIERLDSTLGRSEIRRAIDDVLPKLSTVQPKELRAELELVLTAARGHLG